MTVKLPPPSAEGKGFGFQSRDIAVGTSEGKVVALSMEEKEKKERGGKTVLDISSGAQPIRGLAQLTIHQSRLLLLVSTPSRLYAFAGPDSLERLGEAYTSPSSNSPLISA